MSIELQIFQVMSRNDKIELESMIDELSLSSNTNSVHPLVCKLILNPVLKNWIQHLKQLE